MEIKWAMPRLDRAGWLRVSGGVASALLAIVLYSRFDINGTLVRDESIYVYGGQQLYHGVAPYDSIFDPKGPLATMLAGLGASLGHLFGVSDVTGIRVLFFLTAVLAVLAMYLLVLRVWGSVLGALAAAVVLASYNGFAQDALPGPDAKTPGVLLMVLCMWLAFRRNWLLAGIAASLTFLDWQPFLIFPVAVVVAAVAGDKERRLRALALSVAGVLIPLVVTVVYFAAAGAFGRFVESTFEYPLTGVKRTQETLGHRIRHIFAIVHKYYAFSGVLFWIGAVLLLAVLVGTIWRGRRRLGSTFADPVLVMIGLTGLFEFGYACTDFQSYPDVFPLLAYPAIGIGAVVALIEQRVSVPASRQAMQAITAAALVLLTVLSAYWFTTSRANNTEFRNELAAGCALNLTVVPDTSLYSLGDPVPLVVTGRRNPDRYIYLDSGVAEWRVKHVSGGMAAWKEQIIGANPSVVVLDGWRGKLRTSIWRGLVRFDYRRLFLGPFRVLVTPGARYRAEANGIQLTKDPTPWPMKISGQPYKNDACGIG